MKRLMYLDFSRASQGRTLFTVVVAIAMVIVVVGLSNARLLSVRGDISLAASASGAQQGRDEVRIELTSNGFAPSEIQHAPGTFAITVENRTISGEYTLTLKAEDGTVVSEMQVQKGSSAWTVNLPTGRYALTEANHSQWSCSIVVH